MPHGLNACRGGRRREFRADSSHNGRSQQSVLLGHITQSIALLPSALRQAGTCDPACACTTLQLRSGRMDHVESGRPRYWAKQPTQLIMKITLVVSQQTRSGHVRLCAGESDIKGWKL
jgi:hypothetical protein